MVIAMRSFEWLLFLHPLNLILVILVILKPLSHPFLHRILILFFQLINYLQIFLILPLPTLHLILHPMPFPSLVLHIL